MYVCVGLQARAVIIKCIVAKERAIVKEASDLTTDARKDEDRTRNSA